MSLPSAQTIRRVVLTGSVTAITATGVWYGAGLKMQRERNQERKVLVEATPAEKIEQMEALRARLVQRKMDLQSKIDQLSGKATKATEPSGRPFA